MSRSAPAIDHLPRLDARLVPAIGAAQMREIDRLAVEEFGITLLQMMEQAGSHLAEVVRLELGGDLRGRRVVVVAGPGNNGGGGLAAARHLVGRGASVRVVLARPALRLGEAGRHQLATLLAMSVEACVAGYDLSPQELTAALADADLVVDALLGYGAAGPPDGEVARLLDRLAAARRPVVSLDVPTGGDPDTGTSLGTSLGASLTACATLTLALPKRGLLTAAGRRRAGRLYLGDLGIPAELYARLGLRVDAPFAVGRIVRLDFPA